MDICDLTRIGPYIINSTSATKTTPNYALQFNIAFANFLCVSWKGQKRAILTAEPLFLRRISLSDFSKESVVFSKSHSHLSHNMVHRWSSLGCSPCKQHIYICKIYKDTFKKYGSTKSLPYMVLKFLFIKGLTRMKRNAANVVTFSA